MLREGDNHSQNGEEQRREDEQPHDAEQDEASQHTDTDTEQGDADEEFLPTFVQEVAGPRVVLEESFLDKAKAHMDAIDEEYNKISAIYEDIGNLQNGFRGRLGVAEKTLLSECFKHLRELVGPYCRTLEWNGEHNIMRIEIGEEEDEDAKEAVAKYNTMLTRCKEFKENVPEAETVIKQKMAALACESIQTAATQEAVENAKKKCEALQEKRKVIDRILADTRSASIHLLPRITTGLITNLQD